MIRWSNETRKLSDLIPAKYNPRKLSEKQSKHLEESISKFSLVDPIIINANNVIIGGHQRFNILSKQGVLDADVRVPDRILNEKEEKELNLRLNKNLGEFDISLLANFDAQMLVDVGFDGDFVDSMLNVDTIEDDFNADDEHSKIINAVTKTGDVYILGEHKLICGDSTQVDVLEKLFGESKADLIYTDPPYNVDYKSSRAGRINNDNLEESLFITWLSEVFKNAFIFSHEHASVFSWFAMSNYSLFRKAIEMSGFKYMQVVYWLKDRFVLSFGQFFHRCTEPCMIFYKDWNKKFINMKYAKNSDMWDLDKLSFEESLEIWYVNRDKNKDYQHPTQKPVRLAERALKRNSEVGHIVLDLFCGSGSTLLCCEQLQRRCFAVEMDPKYCDVIVRRWEAFTGKKAELLNFSGVSADHAQ